MDAIPPIEKPVTDNLPPPDIYDPVIEVYKRDVDRTLLRENLKLTHEQRAAKFTRFMAQVDELRRAAVNRLRVDES